MPGGASVQQMNSVNSSNTTPRSARGALRRLFGISSIAIAVVVAGCERNADAKTPGTGTPDSAPAPQTTQAASATPGTAPSNGDALDDANLAMLADRGRLMGRDSGAMWLVIISDFQCPYCKMWHDSTSAALKRDYVDKGLVRLGYLNLPLPQHPHARNEAEAGLCAAAQGKFWPFAGKLFDEQVSIGTMTTIEPLLDSLGRALALDMGAFARCRKSPSIRALVDSDIQQATRARVTSTPSFLVGDFLVQGVMPYPNFRKAIDTALLVARNKAKGTR